MNRPVLPIAAALGVAFFVASTPALADDDKSRHSSRDDGKGATTAPLMVVDANGKTVGKFGSGGDNTFVQFNLSGTSYAVDLNEAYPGLFPSSEADYSQLNYAFTNVYFFSTDCTGTAFIARKQAVGMKPAAIVRVGFGASQRVYLFPFDGRTYLKGPLFQSIWNGGGCASGAYTVPGGLGLEATGPSIEITGMFKEPFKVE
jgi:hypothetical protein